MATQGEQGRAAGWPPSKAGGILFGLGLAAMAGAAEPAAVADAAERRDTAAVRTLLQTGADVNAAQVDGTTALHWAVDHDDAETVTLLLRARANANAVNRYGVPPLALASTNGNAAIVISARSSRCTSIRLE